MIAAECRHDLIRADGDPVKLVLRGDEVAQVLMTHVRAIAGRVRTGLVQLVERGSDGKTDHPGRRRSPVADTHCVVLIQLGAQQGHAVDGLDKVAGGFVAADGTGGHGDRKARALPRHDLTAGDESVIGVDNGVLGNLELLRGGADRQQLVAGGEPSDGDVLCNSLNKIIGFCHSQHPKLYP